MNVPSNQDVILSLQGPEAGLDDGSNGSTGVKEANAPLAEMLSELR